MKKYYAFTFLLVLGGLGASAQSASVRAAEQEVLKEGLALYESEQASWVATDLLMAQKPDVSQFGGYLSYADGDSVRTIFVQRNEAAGPLKVLHSFNFSRTSITPEAAHQPASRPASAREQRLFASRQAS
jgi:hypothetical protein